MRRAFTQLSLIALAACASANQPGAAPEIAKTVTVEGGGAAPISLTMMSDAQTTVGTVASPIAPVWRAVTVVYDSLGIPRTTYVSSTHLLGVRSWRLVRQLGGVPLSRYLDCGNAQSAPSADTYEVHLTVYSQLQSGNDGTMVATSVAATARPLALAGDGVKCSSKGILESRIMEGVRAQLKP